MLFEPLVISVFSDFITQFYSLIICLGGMNTGPLIIRLFPDSHVVNEWSWAGCRLWVRYTIRRTVHIELGKEIGLSGEGLMDLVRERGKSSEGRQSTHYGTTSRGERIDGNEDPLEVHEPRR